MKLLKLLLVIFIISTSIWLSSCASIPEKATPVENFNLASYLGTWYEIARLDFRFEKDLNNTMAQYSLDEKGNVIVLNSGYNYVKKEWTSAEGKAKFRGEKNVGALKVSFFGPFYSGYNVIALDDEYQYAMVAEKDLKYLWVLSRKKSVPDSVKEEYLKVAEEIGYDISDLIWVEHDRKSPFDE